jgi:hypothetical protein
MDEGEVTITTPDRDLMGDTINPTQMETDTYLAGPAAVNFAHDHSSRLPVAKTIALTKGPSGIRAQFRWRNDPFSREVKAAFDDDVLGASVEFIVPEGGAVPNRSGGYDFSKTILTGWAFTGNPANPRAVKLLKSLRDNLKAIDEGLTLEVVDWGSEKAKQGIRLREEEKMYSAKPTFDVDENQVRALVKKVICEAVSPKPKYSDSPGWQSYRERQRIIDQNERRWKRAQAEGECRRKAWADATAQRSNDLQFCPVLPLPGLY